MIQQGNEGSVHHFALYKCPEDFINKSHSFDNTQRVCNAWDEINMPSKDCRAGVIQFAWAVGGGPMYFVKPLTLYSSALSGKAFLWRSSVCRIGNQLVHL